MITMEGNVFYAGVKYDRENKTITFLKVMARLSMVNLQGKVSVRDEQMRLHNGLVAIIFVINVLLDLHTIPSDTQPRTNSALQIVTISYY
jgi:hypothetical protein